MKKYAVLIILLCAINSHVNGQMTLASHIPGLPQCEGAFVNLSNSGQKIMTVNWGGSSGLTDTIFFYNLDYSFWKMIPCPAIPGYQGQFNIDHEVGASIGILYPSEQLFNTDTFLEAAVFYQATSGVAWEPGKFFIINENGTLTDSIVNVPASLCSSFRVYSNASGVCKAVVSTMTGVEVYNLPGTLPCEACSANGVSGYYAVNTPIVQPAEGITTKALPNPSKDEVKIMFTLPEGVNRGQLQLFNTNGVRIKTYEVDNRFGFILLDNSQLSSGLYYYNIVVNGRISSTQKLVVVR